MNHKRLLVYVAGPYSPTDRTKDIDTLMREVEGNIRAAVRAAEAVLRRGHIPFIPHTHTNSFALRTKLPQNSQFYYLWDRCLLAKCDVIYRYAHSPGADREWQWAEEMGIQRISSVEEIPQVEPWVRHPEELLHD